MKAAETKSKKRILYDRTLRILLWTCAGLTCALLLLVIGFIFVRGLPNISWQLLSTQPSYRNDTIGILPNLINTLCLIFGTLLIVLPLGAGAAVYLTEYATNKKVVAAIEFASETLTGIPSILYGLVGMLFFCNFLGWGSSVRAGILTMVIMVLPTIMRTTQESLKAVPQSYREASLGLGSGKWHMIRTVVLPSSMDGIITGFILAIGRIVGESAALLFTAGSASVISNSLMQTLSSSGGSLSVALYMYVSERGEIEVGFAIAAILMLLTLGINLAAKVAGKKLKK
ncbi:MAG TPA: phosphate ABC transporter permease PstA [Candidatus Caccousia avistercoris]|nr:phosphate ABC transporter permease PstA [Candidatus Caccousia avistercoris]